VTAKCYSSLAYTTVVFRAAVVFFQFCFVSGKSKFDRIMTEIHRLSVVSAVSTAELSSYDHSEVKRC